MKKIALTCVALAATAFASASPTIFDLSNFGAYATALAGNGNGSNDWPGANLSNGWTAGQFNSQWNFTTGAAVSASTNYTDAGVTGSGSSLVGLGLMKLGGQNSGGNNIWRHGGGSGGWIDTLTVNAAGKTGQSGTLTFFVNVSGNMSATGFSGYSRFIIANYKNKDLVAQNDIFRNAYGTQEISTDRQGGQFSVTSTEANPGNRVIAKQILFTVPFTFGTSFEQGIFAAAEAKTRSVSGTAGISTSGIDFTNTVTWGGVNQVLDSNGNAITGYSLTSASGTDWIAPVPEPTTFCALSLFLLPALRRRQKR